MAHWLDDPGDPTVADAPDLTAHASCDDEDTPVTTHACGRCGKVCVIIASRDSLRGGLPDYCVHSADGKYKVCATPPVRIVYYPNGR